MAGNRLKSFPDARSQKTTTLMGSNQNINNERFRDFNNNRLRLLDGTFLTKVVVF